MIDFTNWVDFDVIRFCKLQLHKLTEPDQQNDPDGNLTFRWAVFLNYLLKRNVKGFASENDLGIVVVFHFENNWSLVFEPNNEIQSESSSRSLLEGLLENE